MTKIIAAYSTINSVDSVGKAQFEQYLNTISAQDIALTTLTIDPLKTSWFSPQEDNHFRSGCAPLMALDQAHELIQNDESAVVIQGIEPLNSGYSREQRHQLMSIYQGELSIADLYDELAQRFMASNQLSKAQFLSFSQALQSNYQRTYQQHIDNGSAHFSLPAPKWNHHVTSLFRGIDCANPLIDFEGKILICNEEIANQLKPSHQVDIAGISVSSLELENEPQSLDVIGEYSHLEQAFNQACEQADLDFITQFKQGNALLEAYTCYPVVPMAFLLKNKFITDLEQLPSFLKQHAVTVTGGMNLARAPWNNPALNALIETFHQLDGSQQQYAMVHGNGGLGYRQGVALLHRLKK